MMQSVEEIRQGKWARKDKMKKTPSQDYVLMICRLYGDVYDDREEDSKIKGLDWEPGLKSAHKSLGAFQKELDEVYGIHLSRTIYCGSQRWWSWIGRECNNPGNCETSGN